MSNDENRTTDIEEGQVILHTDTEAFGALVVGDGQDGLEVSIDSRHGHFASIDADGERAIRIGDLAVMFRTNSTGSRVAASEFLDLLKAFDSSWVESNGITVDWLLG